MISRISYAIRAYLPALLSEVTVLTEAVGRGAAPTPGALDAGGSSLPARAALHEEVVPTLIRMTGGNLRSLHRSVARVARILDSKDLEQVTGAVGEAAGKGVLIGQTRLPLDRSHHSEA